MGNREWGMGNKEKVIGNRGQVMVVLILLLCFSLLPITHHPSPVFAVDPVRNSTSNGVNWDVIKGDHFIVYYQEDKNFARRVLNKAEYYLKRITEDIGYTRYSDFWLWEKRGKIYIYKSQAEYLKHTHQATWAAGHANYKERIIVSSQGAYPFLTSLLPHELTHLIFREFVGFEGNVPPWLDEGIAQYYEGYRKLRWANSILRRGSYLSWERLHRTNPGILRMSSKEEVDLFYAQSLSMVDYLISEHGSSRFANFCRQLRDGKDLDKATSSAYFDYKNGKKMYDDWLKHLQK